MYSLVIATFEPFILAAIPNRQYVESSKHTLIWGLTWNLGHND